MNKTDIMECIANKPNLTSNTKMDPNMDQKELRKGYQL